MNRLLLCIALLVGACSNQSRITTLSATQAGLNYASLAFGEFDATFQIQTVDKAKADGTSKEDLDKKLGDYRVTQQHIKNALLSAYKLVSIAFGANDKPSLDAATAAYAAIIGELASLGVKL